MDYLIRPVRAEEWLRMKELRLVALADPAAPVAFLETTEQALERPDSFWQERTAGVSHGTSARQFVAEAADGELVGTVVVLVEQVGAKDIFGIEIASPQAHLVGVFVRAEHRGAGLTERLFKDAMEWAWSLEEPAIERIRLYVHEDNPRAQGFYRKIGFVPTGVSVPLNGDAGGVDFEMEVVRP
ncbi:MULTISPECIES: GNAT family N-acetyltransferase [unclassified Streptomyces]|uniref:GNAT family N-acetyltransferase n=1 Tax=unclassified Streptomyces TaxID=2593676 RepID=UPI0038269642